MKLSELKPCASCNGPLLKPPAGNWYVIRQTIAMVSPNSAQSVMGLAAYFRGHLGLAEAFAPEADKAVMILADQPGAPKASEIHICMDCYVRHFGRLGVLLESSRQGEPS